MIIALWGSAYAQIIESPNSMNDEPNRNSNASANIIELNGGNITLPVPKASAITIEFLEKGWAYTVIASSNVIGEDFINLASIEETGKGVIYYFYRLSEGTDVLNFKRLEGTTVYSIIVTLQWDKNIIIKDNKHIYKDEYMIVKSINNSFIAPDEQSMQKNTSNAPMSDTSMSADTIISITPKKAVNNKVDDIGENNRSALINEDEIINLSELDIIKNNSDENTEYFEYKEDVITVFEELDYDEMIQFIDDNWNTIAYDEMMNNISLWINSHPNMFQQSSLLWMYVDYIASNITRAEDIRYVSLLCKNIINNYPLGYEYEKAQELLKEIAYSYKYLNDNNNKDSQ